jgi:hypothetical protein
MSNEYSEGPRSEPWEIEQHQGGGYIQRRGYDQRFATTRTALETLFFIEQADSSEMLAIAARLNRLDALESALRTLVDAVQAERDILSNYISDDYFLEPLAAAEQVAREVLR